MELYRVIQIGEADYGCEELPEGAPVLCHVSLEGPAGEKLDLEVPDAALAAGNIQEGDTVLRTADGLEKVKPIRTSALIGLGALGILFGRKMPGVQVIADPQRAARYAAEPVLCNGQPCQFSYCAPEAGQPVDLILVTVKATALDAAIPELAPFVGPDTVILSLLNGITSEERIEAAYPGHTLWSVAIGMDANRKGRQLVFKCPGKIQFGEKDGTLTPRVAAVAQYLEACGIEGEPCTDILYKQWHKLMINVGLNQASAAFGMTYGGLAQEGPERSKMLEAMEEVIRLANAEGVPLPPTTTSGGWPPPSPPSNPTTNPPWARTWMPTASPRWRSSPAPSGGCRPNTACPPPPTTFSIRRSGPLRPAGLPET